jgi:adenylate cyclase
MDENKVERKLAAILHADVVGYSRMMGQDEVGTHRILSESLDAITALIDNHGGKVMNLAGDAVLADFPSVVEALACAVDIQRDLKSRNEMRPEEGKFEMRIGLNLGDVIVDRDDIYGDGVNVAARLQSIAEPGGICVARAVYEQVKGKMELDYESLGEQRVKNIAEPVTAYRVLWDSKSTGKTTAKTKTQHRRWRPVPVAIAGVAVVVLAAIFIRHYYPPSPSSEAEDISPGLEAPQLPARPSIAVLPFKNLSADPADEYFTDGVTEDIITDLSKFRDLFIIASNTVFTYKGKSVNIQDVSRELGVRYVLEGSIQKAGEKIRVNVQLIDGATGHHLWAERLARGSDDLFALQDEIVRSIVATMATKVDAVERERIMRKGTKSLKAYDYVLRGREYRARNTRAANAEAQQLFRKAIELDPRYGSAYVGLAWCYFNTATFGWAQSPSEALEQVHDLAQKALSLEASDYAAHRLLGTVYMKWMQYDLAIKNLARALELNPNDADTYDSIGAARLYSGQWQAAVEPLETALRFDPNARPDVFIHLGFAYYLEGRYDDAIAIVQQSVERTPNLPVHHVILAAAHAQAGHTADAEQAADNVRRSDPFFEVDSFGTGFRDTADRSRIAEGLRKAGLE